MHFTYQVDICHEKLMQGDVLERTPEINSLLENIHPHFHQHSKNLFFMVLTQSCDLVPDRVGGKCKAPYITIAPVRSLDFVVDRHILQLDSSAINAELPVLSAKSKTKATEFLQRLFNNNESGYFFLDSTDTPLPNDCVVFLNLSIAIKADLHYQTCLNAKQLQLTDTFQAKLGWLVGQMYSRVGTTDWDKSALTKKINGTLKDAAIWIDDDKFKALQSLQKQTISEPNVKLSSAEVQRIIKAIPKRKQQVLDQAERIIASTLSSYYPRQLVLFRKELDAKIDLTSLDNQQVTHDSEQITTEAGFQSNEHQAEKTGTNSESELNLLVALKQRILDQTLQIIDDVLKDNQEQIKLLRKRMDNDEELKKFLN